MGSKLNYANFTRQGLICCIAHLVSKNNKLEEAANLDLHYSLLTELDEIKYINETQQCLLDAKDKEIKRLNNIIKKIEKSYENFR